MAKAWVVGTTEQGTRFWVAMHGPSGWLRVPEWGYDDELEEGD